MKRTDPPFLAAWMLEHWTPGGCNHALAGDLREEFRAGRSVLWYWSQVLSAIFIRGASELRFRWHALLFAVLWSMLAPAWLLTVARLEQHAHLDEFFSRMNWPWSTILDFGLILAANLLFLWSGILLYLFPDLWLNGNLRLRALARGVKASVPALLVLWLMLIVLPKHFVAVNTAEARAAMPMSAYPPQSPERLTLARLAAQRAWAMHDGLTAPQIDAIENDRNAAPSALTDLRLPALLARLPFFLVVLCTLWSGVRHNAHPHNEDAA
jgi:hypothetical protein